MFVLGHRGASADRLKHQAREGRKADPLRRSRNHPLRPGMYGRVEIDVADDGLALPVNAVLIDAE